jgi:hypothetical protein
MTRWLCRADGVDGVAVPPRRCRGRTQGYFGIDGGGTGVNILVLSARNCQTLDLMLTPRYDSVQKLQKSLSRMSSIVICLPNTGFQAPLVRSRNSL